MRMIVLANSLQDYQDLFEYMHIEEKKQSLPTVFKTLPPNQWRCDDLDDNYCKFVEIGSGTYGCVYKAENRRTGRIVAIKKMSYLEDNKFQEGFPITTIREIRLLQNLNHPNILNINEVLIKRVKDSFPVVHICLDYMDYDLDRFVEEKQYPMNVGQIRYVMKQLLLGLEYLHKNHVVHRDLKPKNILVNKEGSVKIADFGLAKMIKNRLYLTVKVVTLWYRAPQLFLGLRNYSTKIDMWSLGCLLAQLMIRKPLFYHQQNQRDMINKIYSLCGTPDVNDWEEEVHNLDTYIGTKPQSSIQNTFKEQLKALCPAFEFQNQLLDLLGRMMELNPHSRISASQALAHSFFKQQFITPSEFVTSQIIDIFHSKSKKNPEPDYRDKKYKH